MRDLPLWARLATVALAVFASWWLVETETIRAAVGTSVAWLALGVVAAFALRGMHVPLGLWPDSAMRSRFSAAWVIGTGVAVSGLLLLSRPVAAHGLLIELDSGRDALVIVGGLAWGYSLAFARQKHFIPWYLVAAAAALLPVVAELSVGRGSVGPVCWYLADGCRASIGQALALSLAVATPSALVTVELAFRRVLLGRVSGAGVLLVVIAAVLAALWRILVGLDLVTAGAAWWWVGAGVSGGAVYALSGSLLVSSVYAGLAQGAAWGLRYGLADGGGRAADWSQWSAPALAVHLGIALVLLVAVWRRNGVMNVADSRGALEAEG